MSSHHRPLVHAESGMSFYQCLKTLLEGLTVTYPECPLVQGVYNKLTQFASSIPVATIAEIAVSKWNHEFEKVTSCGLTGYQLCDRGWFRELLGAGIKPLVEMDMINKWHDDLTDSSMHDALTQYVIHLNMYARKALGIAVPSVLPVAPSSAPISNSSSSSNPSSHSSSHSSSSPGSNSNSSSSSSSSSTLVPATQSSGSSGLPDGMPSLQDMVAPELLSMLPPALTSQFEQLAKDLCAHDGDMSKISLQKYMTNMESMLTPEDRVRLDQQAPQILANPQCQAMFQQMMKR